MAVNLKHSVMKMAILITVIYVKFIQAAPVEPREICPDLSLLFLPFGGCGVGDSHLPFGDDKYTDPPIQISQSFKFFGQSYSTLIINHNGLLTFNKGEPGYTPRPFPLQGVPKIAPYWGDVDTREGGYVFYREVNSSNSTLLRRASNIIVHGLGDRLPPNFKATWALVATWYRVPFFEAFLHVSSLDDMKTNTFQAILVTNGELSFAIFNYNSLTWTSGGASGGDSTTGLGGIAAQVGFDAGDGKNYYSLPESRTESVLQLTERSNINVTGRFIFQIDNTIVTDPKGDSRSTELCQKVGLCCISMGNLYVIVAGTQCGQFTQRDTLNHPADNIHQHVCPDKTKFDVQTCVCNHAEQVKHCASP